MADIREIWVFAHNILRSSRLIINEELKPLGLSSAEGNLLFHLLTQEQAFVQEVLVEQLDISKAAVSRALDSLERKGYIQREKDLADKRANKVLVTAKAQEIGARVIEIYEDVFATAAEGLSPAEVNQFIDLFGLISERFNAALEARRQHRRQHL